MTRIAILTPDEMNDEQRAVIDGVQSQRQAAWRAILGLYPQSQTDAERPEHSEPVSPTAPCPPANSRSSP